MKLWSTKAHTTAYKSRSLTLRLYILGRPRGTWTCDLNSSFQGLKDLCWLTWTIQANGNPSGTQTSLNFKKKIWAYRWHIADAWREKCPAVFQEASTGHHHIPSSRLQPAMTPCQPITAHSDRATAQATEWAAHASLQSVLYSLAATLSKFNVVLITLWKEASSTYRKH